jgi:hypothetical protein
MFRRLTRRGLLGSLLGGLAGLLAGSVRPARAAGARPAGPAREPSPVPLHPSGVLAGKTYSTTYPDPGLVYQTYLGGQGTATEYPHGGG